MAALVRGLFLWLSGKAALQGKRQRDRQGVEGVSPRQLPMWPVATSGMLAIRDSSGIAGCLLRPLRSAYGQGGGLAVVPGVSRARSPVAPDRANKGERLYIQSPILPSISRTTGAFFFAAINQTPIKPTHPVKQCRIFIYLIGKVLLFGIRSINEWDRADSEWK